MIHDLIDSFKLPKNLITIIQEEEVYEDYSFDPIFLVVQETIFNGKEIMSFQIELEVLNEYEDIDGDEWEEIIKTFIKEEEPKLLKFIYGDSESSTCVIWTNNESNFKSCLKWITKLIDNKKDVYRIKKTLSS